jgi:DeoR/GlpR family transcriptional regulator of sugar metabolism
MDFGKNVVAYYDDLEKVRSGCLSPSTERMLTRVKAIYLFINEKGTVTTQQLVDEFGTTQRTIQRDLNVLTYNNLVTSPARGKWATTSRKVKLA